MTKTEKYQLNQWDPEDPVLREDFCEDNRKIEAALKGQLQFVTDTYTGTGESGKGSINRIEFPFKPLLVIVAQPDDGVYGGYVWFRGMNKARTYVHTTTMVYASLTWGDRAIEWCCPSITNGNASLQLNTLNQEYAYIALGIAE